MFAGTIYTFQVDFNSLQEGKVGALLRHATDPLQAQLYPPPVGNIALAVDPDDGTGYWATVAKRHNDWLLLEIGEPYELSE